jgi:hypothetical protein
MLKAKFNKNKVKKVKRASFHHSKTSKKIIIFVIASIFVYTSLSMLIQFKTGLEISPTLTTCYFGFCTGELWMLASIKKSKLKTGQKDTEYQISEIKNSNDDEPVG